MRITFPCCVLESTPPKKKDGHKKYLVEVPADVDGETGMKLTDPILLPVFAIGEHQKELDNVEPGELLDVTCEIVSKHTANEYYSTLFYVKSIKLYQ